MHNIGFRRNLGPQVGLLGVFPLSKYQQTSVTAKDLCCAILLSFALRNVVVNAESVRFFWDFSVPFYWNFTQTCLHICKLIFSWEHENRESLIFLVSFQG